MLAMTTRKRKHIQVGQAERVIVRAGKIRNQLHIDVTLTARQELNLLKMLKQRHPDKKK
jgi:hypothetical protein